MTLGSGVNRVWRQIFLTGVVFAICGSVVLAASQGAELRKHPPDALGGPLQQQLQALVAGRYPRLLREKITGTAIVTILLNPDGTLGGANFEVSPSGSGGLAASEMQFARFGLAAGELRYIGVARIQLPLNTVRVVFGGRDSRDLDRALVERFFAKLSLQGVSPGTGIWILFDHEGRVLHTGEEPVEPAALRKTLEARYPGIRTSEMTTAPAMGRDGRPITDRRGQSLQLYCVWLAIGSPPPNP